MKSKAIGMFTILLMALSIVGFAYAHWSESIFINGTVDMGSLTIGFTTVRECTDKDDGALKDIGEVKCELSDPVTDPHSEKTVYKKLTVTITNGYPGYWAECFFTIDGAGTIPGTLVGVTCKAPPEINVECRGVPLQVDPCSAHPASLYVDIKQDALECHDYVFECVIEYTEYN